MAKAELNFKTETRTEERLVVTEVEAEVADSVTLTLTLDEARLVRSLVGHTQGGGFLRTLVDKVYRALGSAGVGIFEVSEFEQTPKVKTLFKAPKARGDNIPRPKKIHTKPIMDAEEKPEADFKDVRIGDRIMIMNPWMTGGEYGEGDVLTVTMLDSMGDGVYVNCKGDRVFIACREFEVLPRGESSHDS